MSACDPSKGGVGVDSRSAQSLCASVGIRCIHIYLGPKNLALDGNSRNLRQHFAQLTHCLFSKGGSQLLLGSLPMRQALLILLSASFG